MVLTTAPIKLLDFKDYLLNSIEKIKLENSKYTRVAILGAHGTPGGNTRRDLEFKEYESLLNGCCYEEKGHIMYYNGLRNDSATNNITFRTIDVFGGSPIPESREFNEEYLIKFPLK